MALFKRRVTTYQLPDGSQTTPDGRPVTKETPGAVAVKRPAKRWSGKVKDSRTGRWQWVKLCESKEASRQLLAKLQSDAALAEHGIGDRYAEHHKRPLAEHLEDYAASLRADGDTEPHVRRTVSHCRRISGACKCVFIRDLSASAVQAALARLRTTERPRAELPIGQEWFSKAELVVALGIHPDGLSALLHRHELHGTGNGKARRFPRAAILTLQERLCRGRGTTTVNGYLRAVKSFTAWMLRDRRTGENPLAHLALGNPKLDPRHERRALPLEELRLLLVAASASAKIIRGLNGKDREILYAIGMGTGFRVGELASLTPESFELSSDPPTVALEAAEAKNRKAAVQPIRRT